MKELNKLSFEEIRILEHKIAIENYLKEELKKENRSASNFIEYLIEKWEKGE